MEPRLILTEKGKIFIDETVQNLKNTISPSSKKSKNQNLNLPSLNKENKRYSIIENYVNLDSEMPMKFPNNKNIRARSLYFYHNNKTLMDFHNRLQNKQNLIQKPTIFSKIRDPYDNSRRDFHKTSVNLLNSLQNKFNSTQNSQFMGGIGELNTEKSLFFSIFSPSLDMYNVTNANKNILNDSQRTFFTKPLVKHLNDIEIIDKMEVKKLNYLHEKIKYFEKLKDDIEIKKESGYKRITNFMTELQKEEKLIETLLQRKENEKDRFLSRLNKYKCLKFKIKNKNNIYYKK